MIRFFGVFADPDACFWIIGEFGTAEEERVDLIEVNPVEVDSFGHDIEALSFQVFFYSKDFVERAGLFGVSDFQGEGHQLDPGFRDVFGESGGGAIDSDLDVPAQGHSLGVL
ncbi:MAG: hypothetical protein KKH85_01225 [Proteobacteria bacterium]|jgi:hypothetical protein|nr:hypothetical protein [Pseudomonadota bacterium]